MKAATAASGSGQDSGRISIHAAREGGDQLFSPVSESNTIFQSTPPVKAATCSVNSCPKSPLFQSTPPVKAATSGMRLLKTVSLISIHAAREGGDWLPPSYGKTSYISIHAAREGGDFRRFRLTNQEEEFQSTPPVKAATARPLHQKTERRFQSTPPVKAATPWADVDYFAPRNFNPRRP